LELGGVGGGPGEGKGAVSAEGDSFPHRSPAGRCPPGFGAFWGSWVWSVDS
jgi:hypothetical protein